MTRTGAYWLVIALAICSACSSGPPDEAAYVREILAFRADKDREFREKADSPVPIERRGELLPLSYFPVDPSYRVPALLRTQPGAEAVIEMPTSAAKMRKMQRVGVLEFTLKGQPMKLGAFVEAGSPNVDRLFVPFGDLTTGTETYPAGRYLDLDRTRTGIYEIDFNRAYHPFCYYDTRYDCPYPPSENRLKIPIRAGERLPKK